MIPSPGEVKLMSFSSDKAVSGSEWAGPMRRRSLSRTRPITCRPMRRHA
jgi:hypothetical protein